MPESVPDNAMELPAEWLVKNLANLGDGVITTDIEGRVTSLNPVAEFLTGWTQLEAINLLLTDIFCIVHSVTRVTLESPTIQTLRNGANTGLANHTLLISRDGAEYPIGPVDHSATPIRNSSGELTGAVLIFRNIAHLYIQERAVRTSLAYADNIIATLREPFLVLDNALHVKTANHAFYKAFHVEMEQTQGRLIYELGGGQWDIPELRTLLENVLSRQHPIHDFCVELDFPTIGNKIVLLNASRIGELEGRPDLILLAIEDITDRKRTEDFLRQSERHQRRILDSIPQKIATSKPNGDMDYFNPQWTEYTGLSFEKIKNWGWKQFIHPEDLTEHVKAWHHSINTGELFEFESRFRQNDGEYHWHVCRALPIRDEQGQILMWVSSNTDIHDIKLAKTAMKDSEIRYRRLFETAKDGILILDNETGRINDANPFMCEILGYTHDHFLDKELWEIGLFSDKSANEAAVRKLQQSGYIRYDHLPLETIDGKIVQVEVVANAYEEDHNNVFQCNIRDITERSRLEKQLQEHAMTLADLHNRKDEFLAMLSHELRNPLAPIIMAVQLLSLQTDDETMIQRQARTIIERQVGQMTRLIDDLLEVSRITTGRIHLQQERIGLSGVVERVVETTRPLMEQCRHELTVMLSPQPIWLYADEARLEQVIVNLLTNAAKYTMDGGQITLKLEQIDDEAVLKIGDTGVGIAPDLLPQVFDLFTQADRSLDRSQGGLGIGLSLVQRLVEMHGGRVEVSSVLGQGSEFVVYLPVVSAPAALPALIQDDIPAPKIKSLRVLVVDDMRDTRHLLSTLIKRSGHQVETASDGLSAVKIALDFLPNMVLLDIGLPGIDGIEVAKRLRKEASLNGVMLVALSGYGQEADKQRSLEAGFNHHLVKPADIRKIQQIMSTVLSEAIA